jgi:hypothetical protein
MTGKLSVRVKGFKPWRQNTLHGFIDLVVPEMHMQILGATVHESHGKRWIGLPAKPQLNEDGCARRDERGKIVYLPVVLFEDRKTSDAFSARAVEALLIAHPRAFDAEDAP